MSDARLELLRDAYGFMVTQAIAAMARAGVADLVAAGPLTIAELAAQTGLAEDPLRRIVRALAELGIFAFVEGRVVNTPKSEFLRAEVDGSVAWIAQSFGGEHYRVWARADASFHTGQAATPEVLGSEYFNWLGDHPDEAATFNRAMAAGSALRVQAAAELPWSDEVVVDVGGGTGKLVAELLARHPRLRGIVFDLPHAEAGARANLEAAGVAERGSFASGDFFGTIPPGGDVYVLAKILHDWDDEPATRILRGCRAAMSPESRLLLFEWIVPEEETGLIPKLLDLHMLVLLGGRERTAAEWERLLAAADFRLAAIHPGPNPVLEARPVPSPAETT
jgi:hypothetical protein